MGSEAGVGLDRPPDPNVERLGDDQAHKNVLRRRHPAALAAIRARWHWLLPVAVIFGLLTPLFFTDRTFSSDWGNHMWLIWEQGLDIRSLGEPSYFLQTSLGAFYPYYAFYGGSIYTVLGAVSWLLDAEVAVVLAYAGSLAAAYLGWTWIARQAGIEGWRAQLPGCIAVTAPYAVTNLYGRGDIPEVIATSMIPLIAASAISLVRERRVRLRTAAIYVSSVAVLTGTHTLTLVWGTTFLLVCVGLLVICNWRTVVDRFERGLILVWLTVLGIGVNSWILMPLVLYHDRLQEGGPDSLNYLDYTDLGQLFSPFRDGAGIHPEVMADVNAQLPVLALAWVLVFGIAYGRFLSTRDRKVALGMVRIFLVYFLLIASPLLIGALPEAFRYVQFPYRILTYVDLALVGLVVLVLLAVQRADSAPRFPALLLAGVAVVSFGLSLDQSFGVRSWLSGRDEALASAVQPPPTWYATSQFADSSAPVVKPSLPLLLRLPIGSGDRGRYTATYPPGPAGTAVTNISTGPYLVDVSGAQPVGRTDEGKMIVALPASPRPRRVRVAAAWNNDLTAGRWLTLASLAAAFIAAGVCIVVRRGKRRPGQGAMPADGA